MGGIKAVEGLFNFGKKSHADHVSFVRPVSFGHLPEVPSIMNGIILPKAEELRGKSLYFLRECGKTTFLVEPVKKRLRKTDSAEQRKVGNNAQSGSLFFQA
jgi:hypothetical protein